MSFCWQFQQFRLCPRVRSTRDGKGLVMHCLPVRRNVEIESRVLDGPNSVVIDQAENRLHVQRALLLTLLGAAPHPEDLLSGAGA